MKKYARIQDNIVIEYPLSEQTIRLRYPLVSFPTNFIPPEGYVEVHSSPQPDFDDILKTVVSSTPVENEGVWEESWLVVDKFKDYEKTIDGRIIRGVRLSNEEVIIVTKQEQEQAAIAKYIEEKAAEVRETRNKLLLESDWSVIIDSPLSEEDKELWMSYRTQLRNVPQQKGFPLDVVFPEKP